jgi:hypothetical protein
MEKREVNRVKYIKGFFRIPNRYYRFEKIIFEPFRTSKIEIQNLFILCKQRILLVYLTVNAISADKYLL